MNRSRMKWPQPAHFGTEAENVLGEFCESNKQLIFTSCEPQQFYCSIKCYLKKMLGENVSLWINNISDFLSFPLSPQVLSCRGPSFCQNWTTLSHFSLFLTAQVMILWQNVKYNICSLWIFHLFWSDRPVALHSQVKESRRFTRYSNTFWREVDLCCIYSFLAFFSFW